VPANAGPTQLQAAQVVTAVAVTAEAAFEANYKVFSLTTSVSQLANLISAFLHSEQEGLAQTIASPQQNILGVGVMNQTLGYVTQEINTMETWYFNATSSDVSATTLLTQLDALCLSFQATEQAATPIQVNELNTGVITASTAFTYVAPQFINPSGGGVPTPVVTPSIIDPPKIISVMNNDQIAQYTTVANAALLTTTTSFGTLAAQPTHGVAFQVTVSVASNVTGGTAPSGQLILEVDGVPLPAQILNANGAATFAVNLQTAGTHRLTAIYLGDNNYQPSSNTQTVVAL
jgi:hypothetical protein